MKIIRRKVSRVGAIGKSSKKDRISKSKPRVKRSGVSRMSVVIENPVSVAPMARMKQMAQEAMKAKGMTEKDVRKILGMKKYEQD